MYWIQTFIRYVVILNINIILLILIRNSGKFVILKRSFIQAYFDKVRQIVYISFTFYQEVFILESLCFCKIISKLLVSIRNEEYNYKDGKCQLILTYLMNGDFSKSVYILWTLKDKLKGFKRLQEFDCCPKEVKTLKS